MTRRDLGVLSGLFLLLLGATAFLSVTSRGAFRPYFGGLSPPLAVVIAGAAGLAAVWTLQNGGWFQVFLGRESLEGLGRAAVWATLFAAVMITVDTAAGLPEDINVPLPEALLFYPVMGFVVEMVFHAIPLVLFLFAMSPLRERMGPEVQVLTAILFTALIEPVFQVVMGAPAAGPSAVDYYVGLHVFLFTLVELHLFRRYDFVTMFGYRMVYYLWWHIVWGHVRLEWLF